MTPAILLSALPADVRKRITPRTRVTQNKVLKQLREAGDAERRDAFHAMLRRARLPLPVAEHRFHDVRRWRFDYAWPDAKVAVEVEGGAWSRGRHTRGKGFIEDLGKYSEAAVAGWIVIRCVPDSLTSRQTETWIRRALTRRDVEPTRTTENHNG